MVYYLQQMDPNSLPFIAIQELKKSSLLGVQSKAKQALYPILEAIVSSDLQEQPKSDKVKLVGIDQIKRLKQAPKQQQSCLILKDLVQQILNQGSDSSPKANISNSQKQRTYKLVGIGEPIKKKRKLSLVTTVRVFVRLLCMLKKVRQKLKLREKKLSTDLLNEQKRQQQRISLQLGVSLKVYILIKSRMKKLLKKVRKIIKRQHIINQLVKTQKDYINDLMTLNNDLRKPMIDNALINEQSSQLIFGNVEALINLNKEFFISLQKQTDNYDKRKSVIGPVMLGFIPFFKIYFEYLAIYYKGDQLINKTRALDQNFDQFLSNAQTNLIKGTFDSLRIKPMQRVPKYVLFLNSYLDTLDQSHPDFMKVKEALIKFKDVNMKNDRSLDKDDRIEKAFLLQEKLKADLLQSTRQYQQSIQCQYLNVRKQKANLHIFNDLALITTRNDRSIIKRISLNRYSTFQIARQCKYYKNILIIQGVQGAAVLIFQNLKLLQQFYASLRELFKLLLQHRHSGRKSIFQSVDNRFGSVSELIHVRVHSAEWEYNMIRDRKELNYCLQFQIEGFRLRKKYTLQYLNDRVWQEIRRDLKFACQLKLSNDDAGFYDQKKNGSMIIEYRKLRVQVQLLDLWKNSRLRCKPLLLPQLLKIPIFFLNYSNPHLPQTQINALNLVMRKQNYEAAKIDSSSPFPSIINYLYYHHNLNPLDNQPSIDPTVMLIKIYRTQINSQYPINLQVCPRDSAKVVLFKLAKTLQVDCILDFCLVLQSDKISRRLDFDELIYQVVSQQVLQAKEQTGFFGNLLGKVESLWKDQKPKLFVRKFIYLPREIEQNYLKTLGNVERHKLILQQLFFRLCRGHFDHLSLKALIKLNALYLYYKQPSNALNYKHATIPIQRIKQIMSRKLLSENSLKQWSIKVLVELSDLKLVIQSFKGNAKQLYAFIINSFQNFDFVGHEGTVSKDSIPTSLKISHSVLQIINQKKTVSLDLNEISIFWSPSTLFISHKYTVHRVQFQNPSSIGEQIQWMRELGRLLSVK